MVLRGDLDPAGFEVFHRLVAAAVAELQLEGLPAKGLAKNLVAETYPEDRQAGFHQVAHCLHGVAQCRRVARAIGEENARRFVLQRLCSGGRRRHHLNLEPVLPEPAQNVVFHSVIVGDDGNVSRRQGLARVLRSRQKRGRGPG